MDTPDSDESLRLIEAELGFLLEQGGPGFREIVADFPDPAAATREYLGWARILRMLRAEDPSLDGLEPDDALTLVQEHLAELESSLILGEAVDAIEFEQSFPEYDFWDDKHADFNRRAIAAVLHAHAEGWLDEPDLQIVASS